MMFTTRLFHLHEPLHDPTATSTTPQRPRRLQSLLTLAHLLLPFSFLTQAYAAPSPYIILSSRDNSNSNSSASKIWMPLVIVGVLLLIGAIFAFSRRRFRNSLSGWGARAALASGTTTMTSSGGNGGQIRVLTADQLAGTTGTGNNRNNNNNNAGSGNTGRNRNRNPRRTRRTPSQISTTSLPAYMKEPGDQEVVIIRGITEMEDADTDTEESGGGHMPTVDEHASTDEHHPRNPEYVVVPPHDMPLLRHVESRDSTNESQQHLMPNAGRMGVREDFDSYTEGNSSFLTPQEILERGEAPPYFEVVAMDSQNPLDTEAHEDANTSSDHPRSDPFASPSPVPTESDTAHSDTGVSRRRTGIFSIFNPRHSRVLQASSSSSSNEPRPSRETTRHTRELSATSLASAEATSDENRPLTRTTTRHRASTSASGSVFSLGSNVLRTMSRSQTNLHQQMTSPSMISLNSISAPLTHTLVRTEFTYPKNGPTPQQLRLIASRESVARFGVPYGPDAVAYAASASRVDLEPPPPGFDEVMGSLSSRPHESAQEEHTDQSNGSDHHEETTANMQEEGRAAETSLEVSNNSESEAESSPALPPSFIVAEIPPSPDTSVDEQTAASKPLLSDIGSMSPGPLTLPRPSATSPSVAASVITGSMSRKPAPLTKQIPPSSFKTTDSNVQPRAPSRASSLNTFVTADETIRSPSPPITSSAPHSPTSPTSAYTTAAINTSSDVLTPTTDSTPRGPVLRLNDGASLSTESVIPVVVEAR